ncbi:fibronectin type III domain-containing protein [Candidatus Sumerlaeota bacterium]|nr:fibronectin type III domain-containing protein [Candidatus Sumerlaeota bacterium]
MNLSGFSGFLKHSSFALLFPLFFITFLMLMIYNLKTNLPAATEDASRESVIVPFESEGEPGLWEGYDPEKIEPIPTPQIDPEQGGRLASPFILTPEKTIKKPTIEGVQPGPPSPSPAQRAGALSGKFIYVNPGHGWTYGSGSWNTQRVNWNEIVEDHQNADQVCFFVIQYLRNAGATVIPIRDVGPLTEMRIIDNDDAEFTLSGAWNQSTGTPFWGDSGDAVHYVFSDTNTTETATVRWTPHFSKAGDYPVFVWYLDSANRTTDARYRIVHKGGISHISLDQRRVGKGWVWLGSFYFDAGSNGYLELINQSSELGKVVIADAARFGSGVHQNSGYPMYEMNAHEYTVFSNAPSSVTDVSDVWCRPRMASYMNNAEIDRVCYMSFHTNGSGAHTARGAMVLKNSASWDGGPAPYVDQFNSAIIHQVDDDLEYFWGLPSRNYNVYTSSYGELTYNNLNGEMTATILESAFHDEPNDANLLKTPGFRQDTARAVLQGIIDYFVDTHGTASRNYPPDSPSHLSAIQNSEGHVVLSWLAPPYGGYGAHEATGYYVYKSDDGFSWDNGIDAGNATSYEYSGDFTRGQDYYFRVSAYNSGGESFPSETAGSRITTDGSRPDILIVSGFRRYDREIISRYYDSKNGWSKRVWPWLANHYNYAAIHGGALKMCGFYFDSSAHEKILNESILLTDYNVVDWILGREGETDETFSATEQILISNYLSHCGRIFISGEEMGFDLDLSPSSNLEDKAFLHNILQAQCVQTDGSDTNLANCPSGTIFYGLTPVNFQKDFDSGIYDVISPDAFTGLGDGAITAMTYDDTGLGAAIQYSDMTKKIVVMGFPFEAIHGEISRSDVMGRIMSYLNVPCEPDPRLQELLDYLVARGGYPHEVNQDAIVDVGDVVSIIILSETRY